MGLDHDSKVQNSSDFMGLTMDYISEVFDSSEHIEAWILKVVCQNREEHSHVWSLLFVLEESDNSGV